MKLFSRVAIVCDHTLIEEATALRGMLEAYRLRVDFYRMVQLPQVRAFFAAVAPRYDYTVIWTHGSGKTAEDMHLAFEVVRQVDGDYDKMDGWEAHTLRLTPQAVAEFPVGQRGALISTACGSGREPLARAFLGSGYQAYIAPVEEYYDATAGLLFCANFFYHLLAQDRDYAPKIHTEREAFQLAARSDPDFAAGTLAFRFYAAEISRAPGSATRSAP